MTKGVTCTGATLRSVNAPLATRKRAEPAAAKNQGLAFVAVEREGEREDGSRSGETAPGRSRAG